MADGVAMLYKAIIVQAVKDYKKALKLSASEDFNKAREGRKLKRDCLRFFESDWAEELFATIGFPKSKEEIKELVVNRVKLCR